MHQENYHAGEEFFVLIFLPRDYYCLSKESYRANEKGLKSCPSPQDFKQCCFPTQLTEARNGTCRLSFSIGWSGKPMSFWQTKDLKMQVLLRNFCGLQTWSHAWGMVPQRKGRIIKIREKQCNVFGCWVWLNIFSHGWAKTRCAIKNFGSLFNAWKMLVDFSGSYKHFFLLVPGMFTVQTTWQPCLLILFNWLLEHSVYSNCT